MTGQYSRTYFLRFVTPRRFFVILAIALFSLLLTAVASAQNSSATDGSTPAGLTPGAPAGSYGLSGFDNINPYNRNMNFRLPPGSIGGPGGAGDTMKLPSEQQWTAVPSTDPRTT